MDLLQNEHQSVPENPFFHRGPIRIQNRHYFFGRTVETRQALQMLRNGQCVSIVGPRRIGTTSFLFHLCDSEVQKAHDLGEEYVFVYIDCQGLGGLDKPQFYNWLWQEARTVLTKREKGDDRTGSISGFSGLRDAIMTVQEQGCKLVFLFDEFETIARNPNLNKACFSDLRSLVPAVVYATASQDFLDDLADVDREVLSSPFFNIFEKLPLGFLKVDEAEEVDEAKEMVEGLLKMAGQMGLFTEEDLAFVFNAGGYFPFFLQLACYRLFEHKVERAGRPTADYESVRQRYAVDAEPHFRYIWRNLDANKQRAVRLVCRGKVSQLSDEQKRWLERKCILHNDAIFSSSFAEFVQRPKAALIGRREIARTIQTKQPTSGRVYSVRVTVLLAMFGLIIGWFAVQVSSPIAMFLSAGLLLIALLLLVSNWPGRAQ